MRADEDDAFLAIDANGNGIVDNGTELFGIGTRMVLEDNQLAANGFVALSQFDESGLGGNDDGFITEEDEVWEYLYLWLDQNADGISTRDEMTHVDDSAFTRFQTIPRERERFDAQGNWLRYWAFALNQNAAPHRYKMVDVYFVRASQ